MENMNTSFESQIQLIGKINTAIHLGHDENYDRAIRCMKKLMQGRAQIAQRCRNLDMPDESKELYYQLLEQYNDDICKLLGL